MTEDISVKPRLEVHVRVRPVMEETPISKRQEQVTMGRFRCKCDPLVDGEAMCRLTPIKQD